MPPPKKNAFMVFTNEWKNKYGRTMSMQDAVSEAGKVWAGMSAQQRGPYKASAKVQNFDDRKERVRLNCSGIPVSQVENEERERAQKEMDMRSAIMNIIECAAKRNELQQVSFIFIMFNYFSKTQDERSLYVPAEMAVCEYTLVGGLTSIYSTFINPDETIYGSLYEAQAHADTTHMLPLPPNAMGNKNLTAIYKAIVKFLRKNEKSVDGPLPPVYTFNEHMPIVQSCLTYMNNHAPGEPELLVYNLHYLFYQLKHKSCELADVKPPPSSVITDEHFNRDTFEYQEGIGCKYHEEKDRSKYCAKSRVTRWCYTFSEYICPHLNIKLLPGKHMPVGSRPYNYKIAIDAAADISKTKSIAKARSATIENELVPSVPPSNSSNGTAVRTGASVSSWTPKYNDETVFAGNIKDTDDFPSLNGGKKKMKKPSIANNYSVGNPWKIPPKPTPPTPTASKANVNALSAQMERIEIAEPPQAMPSASDQGQRRSTNKRF